MRSRLLASAALLAAALATGLATGFATALAQNAPGGGPGLERQDGRYPARGESRHGPGPAARKAERSQRLKAGSGYGQAPWRPRTAPPEALPHPKHNDASLQPLRGQGARSGDPSGWNGAMAQGRLRSRQDRDRVGRRDPDGGLTRLQRQPLLKERGRQEFVRSSKASRRAPDQGMGSADTKEPGHARSLSRRNQTGSRDRSQPHATAPRREKHQDRHQSASVAGRLDDDIRKAQAALNEQGFDAGDPDGKLGGRTRKALISFQKQRGFRATGKIDRTTLQALISGSSQNGNPENSQNSPVNSEQSVPAQNAPAGTEPQQPVSPDTTTGQAPQKQEPSQKQPAPEQPAAASPQQPQPAEGEPPAPDIQMPDTGSSGRVPAGAPQEDYKDSESPPGGDDQR